MALQTLADQKWRRKHDREHLLEGASLHCADDVVSFIGLCTDPARGKLKAAGSHWSLSRSTVSDGAFVETALPGASGVPRNSGFALDMIHLVSDEMFHLMLERPPLRPEQLTDDPCLPDGFQGIFFVHLKSGTRVFDAYSLLDQGMAVQTDLARELGRSLAGTDHEHAYDGPWGFETLGGAGGQTVFGALTTGTHGGDYFQKPISDSVLALHLVTDGGAHYWIEPSYGPERIPLTDDRKLRHNYEHIAEGAPFEIIRDDDVFHAVTVSVGRFGIVTSVVLRVVPQFCLHEHRRLDHWSSVKARLRAGALHHGFDAVHFVGDSAAQAADRQGFWDRFGDPANLRNRFLQIAVSLSPCAGDDHLCGVTQRWFTPMQGPEAIDPTGEVRGRRERGLPGVAGLYGAYVPPDDVSGTGGNTSFISRACSSGNFIAGILREVAREIEEIVETNAVPAAGAAVAALGIGAGAVASAIVGLCAILAAAAILLRELADWIESQGDTSLADAVDHVIKIVTVSGTIPPAVAVMLIRVVFNEIFRSEQADRDFAAISYAVMDAHDYTDRSCYGNAASIEIFFDAARPDLYSAYVDAILSYEAVQQEHHQLFSVGYVSLRYVKGSDGLIAPSRFPETVVIEVAAIQDASGSLPFVMNAAAVARQPIWNATFHWGQFNPVERTEVERQFGPRLERWRRVLATLTQGGALTAFSSEFTRRTGLEP